MTTAAPQTKAAEPVHSAAHDAKSAPATAATAGTADTTTTAAPAAAAQTTASGCTSTALATAGSGSAWAAAVSAKAGATPNQFPGLHSFTIFDRKFTIDCKYLPKKMLGRGAYGVVCACVDQTTGRKVAIKKISDAFEDLVDAKRIVREIKLLRALRHDNIIQLFDLIEPQEHAPFNDIYLVFELADIDLSKSLQINRSELTEGHFQYFTYQLLRGLKYIHSAAVLHRDIKPSNILVYSDCKLKICDFGLSRAVKKNVKDVHYELTEYVVTRWYRPPEIICSSHDYDYKLDVWAVGCIVAEFYLGKALFPGKDNIHQMSLIFELLGSPSDDELKRISSPKAIALLRSLPKCKAVNFKLKFPTASALAIDLLQKCLAFDPAKRITIAEALEHPYVAQYRVPESELSAPAAVNFDWEQQAMTKETLRRLVWEEIVAFRPGAQAKYERWLARAPERAAADIASNRWDF